MEMNRRDILVKVGSLVIAGPAASMLAEAPSSLPAYETGKHFWAMTVDIDKCIGCGNCVKGCQQENGVPDGYFRTWVERYEVNGGDYEHPRVESPDGAKNGFPPVKASAAKRFYVPKLCNHCTHSPCVQVCPVGATYESPDGVVLVDKSYCLGCRYCVQACPYGCRYIHPTGQTVDKCSLCFHRITAGETTVCSEVCPTGARRLADLKNPDDPVHEFLRQNKIQVLKPHMATGAKVYYNDLDIAVR